MSKFHTRSMRRKDTETLAYRREHARRAIIENYRRGLIPLVTRDRQLAQWKENST